MNSYYKKIQAAKKQIGYYLTQIFKVYGNELLLQLEDYNLLNNTNNCIETSTATGFIMEEFITSKLEIYTKNNDKNNLRIIKSYGKATTNSSYDCLSNYQDILLLINIKVEKYGSQNNAVSAINILHNDYVLTNPQKQKCFIIIKTIYEFGKSKHSEQRKILIKGINSYCLEEVDFSTDYKQDHRNWSEKYNPNSGRLNISKHFIETHRIKEEYVSYEKTRNIIEKIFEENKTKKNNYSFIKE